MDDRSMPARQTALGDVQEETVPLAFGAPAFDAGSFDTLSETIGEDGVREIVEIFEAETRQRLRRLATGDQNVATLVREMHTLKGAAGTVACPRLAEFGRTLERAARRGIAPTQEHLKAIAETLEAFLVEVRARNERLSGTA